MDPDGLQPAPGTTTTVTTAGGGTLTTVMGEWEEETSADVWEMGRKTAQGAYAITNGLMAQANSGPSLPMAPTGIGSQLVKKAKITLTGKQEYKLYFMALINHAAAVSPEANRYLKTMLNHPFSFGIEINLTWDPNNTRVDQYATGTLNLANLIQHTRGKTGIDLVRTMHTIVEYWENKEILNLTYPSVNARLGNREQHFDYIRAHNTAITFNNKFIRPVLGLPARSLKAFVSPHKK